MDKEILSVSELERILSKTDYLVPYFNKKDKEPSWDGSIHVYKHAGNNHRKDDLRGRVPVQIKGKEIGERNQDILTYPVDIPDLRNFLTEGGAIFFVVCFNSEGENSIVYYRSLLPFDIKKILKDHGNQATHSISLHRLPTSNKNRLVAVFFDFLLNCEKQRASIGAEHVTLDQLQRDGLLDEISFGCSDVGVPSRMYPMEALIGRDIYAYAHIKYGISLPVEHYESISKATMKFPVLISVKGKTYYNEVLIIAEEKQVRHQLGKSII